jgi:hypothetical protein
LDTVGDDEADALAVGVGSGVSVAVGTIVSVGVGGGVSQVPASQRTSEPLTSVTQPPALAL